MIVPYVKSNLGVIVFGVMFAACAGELVSMNLTLTPGYRFMLSTHMPVKGIWSTR